MLEPEKSDAEELADLATSIASSYKLQDPNFIQTTKKFVSGVNSVRFKTPPAISREVDHLHNYVRCAEIIGLSPEKITSSNPENLSIHKTWVLTSMTIKRILQNAGVEMSNMFRVIFSASRMQTRSAVLLLL